jgi:hypothetical protein
MLPFISILNKMNPVYIVPLSHLFLGLQTSCFPLHSTPSSFLMFLHQNPCMYSSCPMCSSNPPSFCQSYDNCQGIQIMKLYNFSHHPVLKLSRSLLFAECEKQSFTPTQNRQVYDL